MTVSSPKVFTADEATRMLPLVRRIVDDILQAGNVMKTMARETMTGDHAAKLETRIAELKAFIKELEDLGVTYRDWDFKSGIVDFPSEIDGRAALLSWKSDEVQVTHFYYADEAPEKRRSLPRG